MTESAHTMRIGGLAPWFGAKRGAKIHRAIVAALGPHSVYWEPFAGSMAVLMRKPEARSETVNDLHGDVVNLARVVADRRLGPMLYRRLRRVLFAQELHAEAKGRLAAWPGGWDGGGWDFDAPPEPDLERAYWYMILSWMGRNGTSGTHQSNHHYCVRYKATGGNPAQRWGAAVTSIPAWRERLRRVTVLRTDAFGMMERIEDTEQTALYVDPPYLVKGAKYRYDFNDSDHVRLAERLARFRAARVVVSYYDHPRLAELYPEAEGWRAVPAAITKNSANAQRGRNGKVTGPEVLLVRGGDVDAAARAVARVVEPKHGGGEGLFAAAGTGGEGSGRDD